MLSAIIVLMCTVTADPAAERKCSGCVVWVKHGTGAGRNPQYFQAAGYTTFGVSDNPNVSEAQGFAAGFDRFFMLSHEPRLRRCQVFYRNDVDLPTSGQCQPLTRRTQPKIRGFELAQAPRLSAP